jgi:hypothetical protein
LVRPGEEENRRALRFRNRIGNPRQILAAVLHPEPGQFDSRKRGVEITLRGDKNLYLRGVYCRLILIWVGKRGMYAPDHNAVLPTFERLSIISSQEHEILISLEQASRSKLI